MPVWGLFAAGVLSSLMAIVLSGVAVISCFFLAGLAIVTAAAAGGGATPMGALVAFLRHLVRAFAGGVLPFGLPLLLFAWAHGAQIISR